MSHFDTVVIHPVLWRKAQEQMSVLRGKAERAEAIYGGMRVIESEAALVKTDTPVRVHKRRRWDKSGKYHARIQKKWVKRFGYVYEPGIFMINKSALLRPLPIEERAPKKRLDFLMSYQFSLKSSDFAAINKGVTST